MKIIKKFIKDEKGNVLIETSVAIPMLMGLFMGLVFFTNAMRYQLVISMAAKEGAREYQVSGGNDSMAINRTQQELSLGYVSDADVSIEGKTVKVVKPYGFYVPLSNRYLLNIQSSYEFRTEINQRYYGKPWNP